MTVSVHWKLFLKLLEVTVISFLRIQQFVFVWGELGDIFVSHNSPPQMGCTKIALSGLYPKQIKTNLYVQYPQHSVCQYV